jgi:DNA invertase Pin-like site-specific DNA recombinase
MELHQRVPAAQYLRMSTEHQQYSTKNQAAAIAGYAAEHGYIVIASYVDEGRSGLVLNRREALRNLLRDVVSGHAPYNLILVYDVSRWGRFQDTDEAAHYEFLCRSSGIPVHYCAESFLNDNAPPNVIMKALRRMMAAEYSRELSVKVYRGAKRLVELGFRQGGIPGYGLRRMLVSATKQPKQQLQFGQRKSIQEDHVILVPGPEEEVNCIRDIFRMFADEKKFPKAIARELNRRGVPYTGGVTRQEWYPQAINRILKNPKYTGQAVYGQRSGKLHTSRVAMPRTSWTVAPNAWVPIVDEQTFDRAQQTFSHQTMHRTDEGLLDGLRCLWTKHGSLSERLLNVTSDLPSIAAYRHRFGSLTQAFELIGYVGRRKIGMNARKETLQLRDDLIARLTRLGEGRVSVVRANGHFRPRLRVRDSLVSVHVIRSCRMDNGELRWIFNIQPQERDLAALIARLDSDNAVIEDLYVLPNLQKRTSWRIRPEDPGLCLGRRLFALADFEKVATAVLLHRKR